MTSQRIVMLAGPKESTRIVFHALDQAIGVHKVLIEGPRPTALLLRGRLAKLGVRTVANQLVFQVGIAPLLRRVARARIEEVKREGRLDDSPIPDAKIAHVPTVNADETIALLRELEPAIVVVNGTRIISKKVLETIPARFVNMHAGITPLYRGVHGGYWALANGDPSHCGVTVHLVDAGIDTGGILAQAPIQPTDRDSYATYPTMQLAAGIPMLVEVLRDLLAGRVRHPPIPDGKSRFWSHPTATQYLVGRLRNGIR